MIVAPSALTTEEVKGGLSPILMEPMLRLYADIVNVQAGVRKSL
jgi:hypothetical protein